MNKLLLYTLLSSLFFMACRSKRHSASPIAKNKIDSSKYILPEIKKVILNSFDYDYLSFKAKCDYKDLKNDQSFTMNIRMKRDSVIWLSISSVGFEFARALLNKDSVYIISRLEKRYYSYGYDYIKKLSGTTLTLLQIQNLLTANLLFLPEKYIATPERTNFKTTEGYIENVLVVGEKEKIVLQILQHLVEESNARVNYSNYKKTEKQLFPGQVDIEVITPKRKINLNMENSGISTDSITAFPFEISSKYEKGN